MQIKSTQTPKYCTLYTPMFLLENTIFKRKEPNTSSVLQMQQFRVHTERGLPVKQ